MNKKTMTLNITEQEMDILTHLSESQGVSKTAIIRQALRLFQSVELKCQREGLRLEYRIVDMSGEEVTKMTDLINERS